MKKVVIKLDSPSNVQAAQKILTDLTAVMVTYVQGDTLIVHCGQRLDSNILINKLQESGCQAHTLEEAPYKFY